MKSIRIANRVSWGVFTLLFVIGCKLSVVPDVQKLSLEGNVGELVSADFDLTNDYSTDVELIIDEKPDWIRIPGLEDSAVLSAGETKNFEVKVQCREVDGSQEARIFIISAPGTPAMIRKEIVVHLRCGAPTPIGNPFAPTPPAPPEPKPAPSVPTVPPVEGSLYVSPSGRDSGTGSKSDPLKTLSRAVQVARAGDVVVVADGVYPAESSTYGLWVDIAGTPSHPIKFIAANRHRAIIDGAGRTHYGVTFGANARHVTFEGFDIRGFDDGAFFTQEAQNLKLTRNRLHHIGRACTDSVYGRSAIYLGKKALNITIDSNIFYSIGRFGPGEQGCEPKTHYWQNHDHGIYMKASNVTIMNNVFYKLDRGWAIHGYDNDLDRIKILNNTFMGRNPNRAGHIILAGDYKFTNWLIQNNIFEDPNGKAISVACDKVSSMKLYGNISTDPLASDTSCMEGSKNLQNTASVVEDKGNYVILPKESSRACEIGVPGGAPTYDINGQPRPTDGMCAGAYQP